MTPHISAGRDIDCAFSFLHWELNENPPKCNKKSRHLKKEASSASRDTSVKERNLPLDH